MENRRTIQIFFSQNLAQLNSIELNTNAILSELEHKDYIKVLLSNNQTIGKISLFINKLIECLLLKTRKKYNYTLQNIVWGECLENKEQYVVEVSCYLSNTERHE